ncbi:hypothetical protein CALCODRAFT_514161 [Calocera cornea HHB12733]|uniref:Uncharacterized protein n=1 Tax=Calocera cornea HHB12733 TaxID=1353952 RepID=A0A165JW20_9BASI|nr:hypothetical protein CALCODRAFT_514161 [Calocera cornea HHB12733]
MQHADLRETVERQLGTLELLQAVYCAEEELVLLPETEVVVPQLQAWTENPSTPTPQKLPAELSFLLTLQADDNWSLPASIDHPQLIVEITLPVIPSSSLVIGKNSRPILRLRQPSWLSRAEHDQLGAAHLPPPEEVDEEVDDLGYVMASVDRLHSQLRALAPTLTSSTPNLAPAEASSTPSKTVLRTWHHLPSLSTRAKRAELVSYAQSHSPALTGFVLAGKPGLVVLEHPLPAPTPTPHDLAKASASLDAYWSAIKSRSWADIPSSHKKVSERLREVGPRAWAEMTEVTRTEEVGGVRMGGEKGNRQDLASVARYLEGKGVGGRLERVLGAEWS